MKVYKLDPNAPDIVTSKEYHKKLLGNHPTISADNYKTGSLAKGSLNTVRATEHLFICNKCIVDPVKQTVQPCEDAESMSKAFEKHWKRFEKDRNIIPNVKHCPGISDYLKIGYIVPAWIHIKAARVGKSIWIEGPGGQALGEEHSQEQVDTDYFGIETTNKGSHKFYLPYRFEAEEGKGLYLHNDFWSGTRPFSIVEGVVDTRITSTLNVNTFWNFEKNWETFELNVGDPFLHIMEIDIDTVSVLKQYEYDSPEAQAHFKERAFSEGEMWRGKSYIQQRKEFKK